MAHSGGGRGSFDESEADREMGDGGRVPLVTIAGMERSGRAIIRWVDDYIVARTRPPSEWDPVETVTDVALTALDGQVGGGYGGLATERSPEFPTVTDMNVRPERSDEALRLPEASRPRELMFVVVGLAGLVGLCAIYPIIVLWIVSLASGGDGMIWSPITVGIAIVLTFVLALLADRWIPGRLALLLIALLPLAIGPVVSTMAGGA